MLETLKLYTPSMKDQLARCNTRYSKWQLFQRITHDETARININGYDCVLHGIQREDGSGSSFILSISHQGTYYSSYCRTMD